MQRVRKRLSDTLRPSGEADPETARVTDSETSDRKDHHEVVGTGSAVSVRKGGCASLHTIAAGLNAQGIPTTRGKGKWRPAQVARVLKRA